MTRLRSSLLSHPTIQGVELRHLAVLVIAAIPLSFALASVSAPLLLATIAGGTLFLLSLRDLSLGVLATVASIPIQAVASLDVDVARLTWTRLAVIAMLSAWAIRIITGSSRPRLDGIGAALACYVVVLACSIVEARNISAWAEEVYRWTAALAIYLIAIETLRGVREINRIVAVTTGAVLVLSGYAAWQVLTEAGPPTFSVGGLTRAFGTFGEPNPFAGYLEMTVLLLVALVLGSLAVERRKGNPAPYDDTTLLAAFVAALAGTGTLLATQSRGGYLGFATGLAVAVWLTGGKVRWLGTVGGGICLVAVLLSPFGNGVTARFRAESLTTSETQVTTDNFASQERSAHWRAAVSMARTSPLLGVGAGNFNDRFRESTSVWRFRIPRGHAHNAYLHALAQAGLLGLLAYLSLLAVVAVNIVRALKRAADPFGRSVVIGVAAVSVAVAVHNSVEYLHVLSLGLQLSVVWALLGITARREPGTTSPTVPAA
jgi:O-antigen ligase